MVAVITYIEGSLFGICIAVLTYIYSNELSRVYTSNPDTIAQLSLVFEVLAFSIGLVTQVYCLQGTLKAV